MIGREFMNGAAASPALSQTYRPVIRGYFAVAMLYYAVMALRHLGALDAPGRGTLALVAVITVICTGWATFTLRRECSEIQLESVTAGINFLVLLNVMVALEIDYAPAKLTYFVMMVMIFGLAWSSLRQSLLSIAAAFACLYWELSRHNPELTAMYAVVSLGAAMTAITITHLLQRAIRLAYRAREEAECARCNAESRLQEAQTLGERLRRQSLSDSLTGLPNRRAFFKTLEGLRERSGNDHVWLILLDLDGFKAVKDNYGHVIGDELLKAVAERLRTHCAGSAQVSRMGGDEFNLILAGDLAESIEAWCERLLERLAEVYLIDERLVLISGSIGCCQGTLDEADARLIQRADYALLHAKRHGKNRVVVFRDEHAMDAARRFAIEQALRSADYSAEFTLAFQPQFDLDRQQIISAEALARWNSPVLGPVEPDVFIGVAEDCGLISRITLTVVHQAIAALQAWDRPIALSINLSSHDLMSDPLIEQIIALVRDSGVNPGLIEFEVTETAMMLDMQRASRNLLRLTALGHPIALDDFGTGYSNFNYLRTLPISKLKIDRSFLENIGDPMTEKILHSLAGMARTLNVGCLLEGIESELELVMAKRVGARLVQGYLFGRPMSAAQLAALQPPPMVQPIVAAGD